MPDKFSLVEDENREADLIDLYNKDPGKAYGKLGLMVERGFEKNFKHDKKNQKKNEELFSDIKTELGLLSGDFEKYEIENEADKKAIRALLEEHKKVGHKKKKKYGKSDWIKIVTAVVTVIVLASGAGATQM